ncbi:MAG: SRPBCC family protein [Bdellovibrionia bacterium]
MSTIQASVTIQRPVEHVFRFYQDFRNLPRFLGDVMSIKPTGPGTAKWTIQGPLGMRVHWTTRVTELRPNELIRYQTLGIPGLSTVWEIRFSSGAHPEETKVREVMKTPFGRLTRGVLTLIGKPPAKEIASNLHRLKELLEQGNVTDLSHSVRGKFDRHA